MRPGIDWAGQLPRACKARLHGLAAPLVALLGTLLAAAPAQAQMFSYSRADSVAQPTGDTSLFAYRLGYLQKVSDGHWLSFDYVNEGHFEGHHRDGYALQATYKLWASPRFKDSLFASAGPYYYFDTQTVGGQSHDRHGLAPALGLAYRHELNRNFDLVASVDGVWPSADFHAYTVGIGVAHWLGRPSGEASFASVDSEPVGLLEAGSARDRRVHMSWTLSGAVSVINMVSNPRADGGSAELRWSVPRGETARVDASVAFLNEGDPRVARRSGASLQVWPVRSDPIWNFDLAVGFGAYVFVDKRHEQVPGKGPSAAIAPILSVMLTTRPLWRQFFVRVIWDRIISNYDRDADVWRVGLGRAIE